MIPFRYRPHRHVARPAAKERLDLCVLVDNRRSGYRIYALGAKMDGLDRIAAGPGAGGSQRMLAKGVAALCAKASGFSGAEAGADRA
jgi:hypothetical protein